MTVVMTAYMESMIGHSLDLIFRARTKKYGLIQ